MLGNTSRPPQIIVIPQSMLSQQTRNLLQARMATNTTAIQLQQPIVLQQQPITTSHRAVLPLPRARPVATVVGSKRPLPTPSPTNSLGSVDSLEEEEAIKVEMDYEVEMDHQPPRKRANLDHLSPEERLMRRKMKNRVAAQTARDKKKAYMDEMEQKVALLVAEKTALAAHNQRLTQENATLRQENTTLAARLAQQEQPLPSLSVSATSASCQISSQSAAAVAIVDAASVATASAAQPPEPAAGSGWVASAVAAVGIGSSAGVAVSGPRVVAERLDDRAGGGIMADDDLLCRLVDSSLTGGLRHNTTTFGNAEDNENIDVSVEGSDGHGSNVTVLVAAEEASQRLLGDGTTAAYLDGATARLMSGPVKGGLQLSIQRQQPAVTAADVNGGQSFDLDTSTTERLLEELWPEVRDLDEDQMTVSWPTEDFDLLFPDLV